MTKSELTIKTKADLANQLTENQDMLQEYLGKDVDVPHYIRGVVEEFDKNHALYSCTPASIFQAIRKAAHARLPMGQELFYLVPYARNCQFVLGYKGMLYLARESGAILRHVVRSVHQADEIDYDPGLKPWIKHKPLTPNPDFVNMTHVYAHFLLPNDLEHLEVMTREEVIKAQKHSTAKGKESPWQKHPLSMAKKAVIRAAFKGDQIPLCSDLKRLVLSDELNDTIEGQVVDTSPDAAVIETIEQQGGDESGLFDKHEQTT